MLPEYLDDDENSSQDSIQARRENLYALTQMVTALTKDSPEIPLTISVTANLQNGSATISVKTMKRCYIPAHGYNGGSK